MNNDDKLRSAFRTVELTMIAMLALGATNNFVFWITFALAANNRPQINQI